MFKNISGKIKTLAIVFFVLGVIVSAVSLISWLDISANLSWEYRLFKDNCVRIAWGSLVGGVFTAWAGSILIYGFGELIEKTSETAKHAKGVKQSFLSQSNAQAVPSSYVVDIETVKDIEATLPKM